MQTDKRRTIGDRSALVVDPAYGPVAQVSFSPERTAYEVADMYAMQFGLKPGSVMVETYHEDPSFFAVYLVENKGKK